MDQFWNTTENVFQNDKAYGTSGYGQITWDFQTGPLPNQKLAEMCDDMDSSLKVLLHVITLNLLWNLYIVACQAHPALVILY